MVLHRVLPTSLFKDGLEQFISICERGQQGEVVFGFWSKLMDVASRKDEKKRAQRGPQVSARSFPLLVDAAVGDNRLIVIGAPPPQMTPQARFIACWFNNSNPQATLRYFAAETSMDEGIYGDVLGEWTSEGAHRNFGSFCAAGDSSAEIFASAVARRCMDGLAKIDIATVDSHDATKTSRRSLDGDVRRADVRKRIARRVQALGDEKPKVKSAGPLTWESESDRIASDIIERLRSAQSQGQSVLIASAEHATGLRESVSTYIQFKILNKKKLLTEVQGDYSYWGVAVQSRDWPKFTVLGFTSPSSSNGNFSIVYQDFRDDRKIQEWLTHAVSAMQEVIEPKGEITYKCF